MLPRLRPPRHRRLSARLSVRGFTLIEVLVAIVVLSFGLLGMVGLQGASLRANREARLQATGVRLASEIADMMRGNKAVAIQTTATANPYLIANYVGGGTIPNATASCVSAACATALDVAKADIADWLARVNGDLPSARVVICFDATPYTSAGLPQWACSNSGGVANVKIGWTRGSTRRGTDTDAFSLAADAGSAPAVILPITVGN